jgi:hypothetical protein
MLHYLRLVPLDEHVPEIEIILTYCFDETSKIFDNNDIHAHSSQFSIFFEAIKLLLKAPLW